MKAEDGGRTFSFNPDEMIDVTRTLGFDSIPWPGAKDYSGLEHDFHGYVITSMRLTAHAGTHMDAPRHRFPGGRTIDKVSPSSFVCRAVVLDCGDAREITAELVGDTDLQGKALLLRTSASSFDRGEFRKDYPALTGAAAELVRDRGAVLVGIDYLSTDLFGSDDVHDALLGADIVQVEDLKLDHVAPGEYILFCFPLKIHRCEASPVRAFLAREIYGQALSQ